MLTFTRKTDYALVALAELASASAPSMSARELAERTELPPPILRNLLKELAAAGILVSEKGVAGGYRLARSAASISALSVIEAVDRPVQLARCCDGHAPVGTFAHPDAADAPTLPAHDAVCSCPHERRCRIRGAITRLQCRMIELLRSTSIADLMAGSPEGEGTPDRSGFLSLRSPTLSRPATSGRGLLEFRS